MVPSPPSELKPPIRIARRTIEVPFFRERLSDAVVIEMMAIPAGEFAMGSPEDELDREACEGPQHPVQVSSCWMGKYPVTQAQWRIVADWPQVDRALEPEPSEFKGDNRPVEQVNWHEAVEFCQRLSVHTKRPYRLPSEAEWEYACRAGTTSPFHFGETITTKLANYRGTDQEAGDGSGAYGGGPPGEYRQATTPVDQFGVANAFGLCDMHGNVWEWCQDLWHENYQRAPSDGSVWTEEGDDTWRVIRGGAWDDYPRNCRSAYRIYSHPDARSILSDLPVGFRVVCAVRATS